MQTCIGRSALAASFLSIFLLPVIVFAANPTCTLKASAYSITLGNTVNLTWTSTGAISGTITDLGSVALSGTQGVIPTGNGRTYVAIFTGSSGATATCKVTITTNGSGTGGTYIPSTYDSTTNTFTPGTYTGTGIFTPGTYNPNTKAYVPSTYTPPKYTAPTAPTYTTAPAATDTTTDTDKTTSNSTSLKGGLVSCGATTGDPATVYKDATECNLCNFGQLIQNIINYMLALAIPISVALFAYVGVLYFGSAANPAGIEKAKGIFKTTFIGLAVAISAFFIVSIILTTLLRPDVFSKDADGNLNFSSWVGAGTGQTDYCDFVKTYANRPRDKKVEDIFAKWTTTAPATGGGVTGKGGTWNGDVPDSIPQTCGGSLCTAAASSDGKTVTYTNTDGTKTILQGGTLPWRNNNPGDIQYGTFATQNGAIGSNGRWAVFPDYSTGAAAEVSLLKTSTYQSLTINGAVNRLAPSFENPTNQISTNVAQAIGVPASTPMSSLTQAQLQTFASTIFKGEGYKAGTISH